MKIGIMQPYFFPYLGYWQLMNEVDTYVIFDDVAYIKRGWINRNQIKLNGTSHRIGIQIQKASQNKKINELYLFRDEKETNNLIKSMELAYKKAPYYNQVTNLLRDVLDYEDNNLAVFLTYSIRRVAEYLGINPHFIISSEIEKDEKLKAQDKIIDICTRLGGDTYINAIGGRDLYTPEKFASKGIELLFLEMDRTVEYPQGKGAFIPNLSILDVMMYNSPGEIQELLKQFSLK